MQTLLQQTWQLPAVTQAPRFSSSWPFPFVRLSKPHPSLFSSLLSQKLQVSKTGRGVEGKREFLEGSCSLSYRNRPGRDAARRGAAWLMLGMCDWVGWLVIFFFFLSTHVHNAHGMLLVLLKGGGRKGQLCSYLFISNPSVTTKLYKLEKIMRKLQLKKKRRADVTIFEYRLRPNIVLGTLVPTTSGSGRVTTRRSQTQDSHLLAQHRSPSNRETRALHLSMASR